MVRAMGRPSKGIRRTVTLRLPPELVERLDSARGVQDRSDFVAQALTALLLTLPGPGRAQGAGPKGARRASPTARPAERATAGLEEAAAPLLGVSSPVLSVQDPVVAPVAGACLTRPCMDASCPDCFEQPEDPERPRGLEQARELATGMMAMAVSRSEESIRGWLADRGIDPDDLESAKAAFAELGDEPPRPALAIDSIPRPPRTIEPGPAQGDADAALPARQSGRTAVIEGLMSQLPPGSVVIASQHVHSAGEIVSRRIASGRVYKRVKCADPGCATEWETT